MTTYPRTAADAIHNSTKHGTPAAHPERLVSYPRLDPGNAPTPFKKYRDLQVTPLSRELVGSTLPAVSVLSGERGDPSRLDASLVATLLYLTAGVTRTTARSGGGRVFFRAAMSAGNLHPVEVYVIAGPGLDGIPAGVHHFAPLEFGLTELRRGDFRAGLSVRAPVALVLTGLVWRTTWKYGERGWRHLYWDAGTMLANLVAAAHAHGLDVGILSGFADETVSRLVGIDGVDEVPLAVVTLGYQSADVEVGLISDHDPANLSLDVAPVAPRPIRLPLLVDAQAESTLTAADVTGWRQGANAVSFEMPAHIDPPASAPEEPIEAVILRRGSTRVMRPDPVAHDALAWPLAGATRAVPLDAAPRGTLLEHYVNVHALDGVRPGAYRLEHGKLKLIDADNPPREMGKRLCLDQPLGGDSAYTVFHNAALDPILDVLGSRGYRAAQLRSRDRLRPSRPRRIRPEPGCDRAHLHRRPRVPPLPDVNRAHAGHLRRCTRHTPRPRWSARPASRPPPIRPADEPRLAPRPATPPRPLTIMGYLSTHRSTPVTGSTGPVGSVPMTGPRRDRPAAIESISAVTLATHVMARSVEFYTSLGFELRYGGPEAGFSSFAVGNGYLNLIAQAAERPLSWWGRVILYVSDVDALYDHALRLGLSPQAPPRDGVWAERYFHLTDPDGHELSFARRLPRGDPGSG